MGDTLRRRDFLRTGAALAGLPALAATERRPNVVLILSDDQHWGDYGFMGHPRLQTPRLDRLAAESLVYSRGYVAAPLCCPSLAAILTGLHPHQTGITTNDPEMTGATGPQRYTHPAVLAQREVVLSYYDAAPTLPRVLAPLGYRSLQTGKWWGGHFSRGGFDEGMTHGDPARGGRHGDEGLKIGRSTMQPVADFLDARGRAPFLLWFAPMLPHQPHNPPERLFEKYRRLTDSEHVARYWAMCEWWDEVCGQLLDLLDARALTRDTIVLYICDNGWIQQPDRAQFAAKSKRSRYDGGLRTPIMIRWPGRVAPRRDETTPVSAVDLAPTVRRAVGLPPDPRLPGVDLLDETAVRAREAVFAAVYSHDARDVRRPAANLDYRCCWSGPWKLIAPHRPNQPDGVTELYDVMADPTEERNLAEARPDLVEALGRRLDAWWSVS